MKSNPIKSLALLFFGVLLGMCLVGGINAAQEYRKATGYAFWSKADDNAKFAYVIGYSDAEGVYRLVLDKGAKPHCTDAGKEWIEDFERKMPVPNDMTIKQTIEGLDDFYRDWKNQSVRLQLAQNIVRLQVAGRSQAEIDEATRKARQAPSEN